MQTPQESGERNLWIEMGFLWLSATKSRAALRDKIHEIRVFKAAQGDRSIRGRCPEISILIAIY